MNCARHYNMREREYKAGMNLQDRLFSHLQDHDLLPENASLVVGVSGGNDSLALVHMLAVLRERFPLKLHIATLDHGLRGELSAGDAHFVAELARAWELEVTVGTANVQALASKRHLSIEAAARVARYDFLAEVAREVEARHIAVAHQADDQVETILHNLLRGAGLNGLSGMTISAPVPGHPDLTLIRPLLGVTRAELEAYCREHGLEPRGDATNEDITLTRNRLRHETLPYLRELSSQIDRHLLQLGEIAALENDFVEAALHRAIDSQVVHGERRISLPRQVFASLHSALQRRFVVWAASTLGQGMDVGYVHITETVDLMQHGQVGARAQLKGGIQLRLDYEQIVIEHEDAPLTGETDEFPLVPEQAEFAVIMPGEIGLNDSWTFYASLTPFEEPDAARIALPQGSVVILRGRRRGDRFPSSNDPRPSEKEKTRQTHKLNEWMIDHKIPRHLRERLPLLVVDGQVAAVWWKGWTVSRLFAPNRKTKYIHYFVIKRINYENRLKT